MCNYRVCSDLACWWEGYSYILPSIKHIYFGDLVSELFVIWTMMNGNWLCRKEERSLLLESSLGIPILLPPVKPQEELFRKPLPESSIPIHIPPVEMIRNNPEFFQSVLCHHPISQRVSCQANQLLPLGKVHTISRCSQKQITAIQVPDPSLIKVQSIP